jgi:Tfp pilus tip-associated adhesin PilY1
MWEYPNPRVLTIIDAVDAGNGEIMITTAVDHRFSDGDTVVVEDVQGTTEANNTWTITWLSSTTLRLDDSAYSNSYISGGTATEVDPSWNDIGYSYSKPAVVNSKAGYIVMFGNGYNSESGIAKLIILNALTGELLKSINTQAGGCNGLSSPTPIDVDFDGLVDYVYAGDLSGNLWKFDLTDASASNWDVAYKSAPYSVLGGKYVGTTPEPLFQARSPEGVSQPITTKPDVMESCENNGYMVTFGTGKWLGEFDFDATTTQTVYGIWDYGDDEDDSEFLGVLDRLGTPQLSNQPGSVTLLEQAVVPCDPVNSTCDGDFWVVNSQSIRVLTDNIKAIANPWETSTLYNSGVDCGAGEGIDKCDPNGYGVNPDPVNLVGWYFDLPLGGERVVSDALLRQGKGIFISYTPSQTPCGAGGDSVVMEMDACTGGRLIKPQFDTNEDGIIDENDVVNIGTAVDPIWVVPTGIQGEGRLHPPAILRIPGTDRERKYFSSSRGKIVTVDEKAVTLGITYWQELE